MTAQPAASPVGARFAGQGSPWIALPAPVVEPQSAVASRATRLMTSVFAFVCFFPYPALAIGANTGLQLSQLLALGAIPFLCVCAPGRSFRALVIVMTPIAVSAFVNLLAGDAPAPGLLAKEAVAMAVALGVLWPAERVARRDLFGLVLGAACAAILVHAAIGLIQVYSFSHDVFPLLFLYRNPSFKAMESWSDVYAMYIKRPCGLFPEPSAMTASLGPWVVVLAGLLLDPGLARSIGWRGNRLTVSALTLGFVLIALSRSGAMFVIMTAVAVVCASKVPSWGRSFGARKLFMAALLPVAAVGVAVYGAAKLTGGEGLEERIDSSWGFRALSIKTGLTINTDPVSVAFGVGPGQSTPVLRKALSWVRLPDDQDDLAVFSLIACYYMECGLCGALALLAVFGMALFAIARSRAKVLGLCALATWFFSVGLTTSYIALSPLWLFLAAILAWDRLFPSLEVSRYEN